MLPLHPHDPPSAGPYRFLARLGEDSRSRSYLGASPGRPPVRVRVLRSSQATDPTSRSAFTHLVESARGLSGPLGPHVASVLDADLGTPVPWVATERPPGPDLAGLVREHGPLPTAALHPLALSTAQGLTVLHSAQRAHGTLVPDSVLLTGDRALLADPGLVPANEVGDAGRSVLDPPEGGGTPAGDVFSWAAVLCFAASGVEGPDGLDRVPPQLRSVIDACLREDANLRPSAADLVSMLGGASASAPWPPELASVVEASAAAMRRVLPLGAVAAPSPHRGGKGRFLALTAGALALTMVVATGAVWGYDRLSGASGPKTEEEPLPATPGMITDAACLDGSGFPDPGRWTGDLGANEAVFSPDGDVLALAGEEHGLSLWDWREGELLALPAEGTDSMSRLVFSPVGCMVSVLWSDDIEAAEEEVRVPHRLASTYDIPTGRTQDHLGSQPTPRPDGSQERASVAGSAFSPDGRWLAIGTSTDFQTNRDDSIGIVDMETGELVRTFNDADRVRSLAFLDDTRLASTAGDSVTIWDVETGELLQTVRNTSTGTVASVPGDGQLLFVRNNAVVWRDMDEGADLAVIPLNDFAAAGEAAGTPSHLHKLIPDADRGLLYVAWSERTNEEDPAERTYIPRAHLWDVATGEDLLDGDDELMARGAAFHPEVIVGVGRDGGVSFMDPDSLEVVDTLG